MGQQIDSTGNLRMQANSLGQHWDPKENPKQQQQQQKPTHENQEYLTLYLTLFSRVNKFSYLKE